MDLESFQAIGSSNRVPSLPVLIDFHVIFYPPLPVSADFKLAASAISRFTGISFNPVSGFRDSYFQPYDLWVFRVSRIKPLLPYLEFAAPASRQYIRFLTADQYSRYISMSLQSGQLDFILSDTSRTFNLSILAEEFTYFTDVTRSYHFPDRYHPDREWYDTPSYPIYLLGTVPLPSRTNDYRHFN